MTNPAVTASATNELPTLPNGSPSGTVAAPADRPTSQCDLTKAVTLIGGRRDCDVTISGSEISQVHAAIVNTAEAAIVVDLASRTGVFVNDNRVDVRPLKPGDRLRIGPTPVALTLRAGSRRPPSDATRLQGPLVLRMGDKEHSLSIAPFLIGRRRSCRIMVDTPDVSLAHALVFAISGKPAILDLGSRSGTYLNERPVKFSWLQDGDALRIGGVHIHLSWRGPVGSRGEAPAAKGAPENPGIAAPVVRLAASLNAADPFAGVRELEALIASFQGEVSGVNASLSERSDRLRASEQRHAALTRELEQARAAVEVERAELAARTQALETGLAELASKQAAEQTRAAALAAREAELAERERRLAQQEAAFAAHAGELERIAEARAELHELRDELALRELALAERESADQEAARQIQNFREMLRQMSEALSATREPGPPDGGARRGEPAPARADKLIFSQSMSPPVGH